MKKRIVFKVMGAVALMGVLIMGSAWGYGDQQGRRAKPGTGEFGPMNGLNLSDSQKEEMKALRITFLKEMTPVKNSIDVKKAQLKAASVGENVDTKVVYKLIDELGKLKTDLDKKHFANRQKMRSVLTDEQKVIFDAHNGPGRRGGPQCNGMRQGRHGDFQKGMKGQGRQRQRMQNTIQ